MSGGNSNPCYGVQVWVTYTPDNRVLVQRESPTRKP